jgi:hypothetical protein
LDEGGPLFLVGTLPVAFVGGSEHLVGSLTVHAGSRDLSSPFKGPPFTVSEGPKINQVTLLPLSIVTLINAHLLDLTQKLLIPVDYYSEQHDVDSVRKKPLAVIDELLRASPVL